MSAGSGPVRNHHQGGRHHPACPPMSATRRPHQIAVSTHTKAKTARCLTMSAPHALPVGTMPERPALGQRRAAARLAECSPVQDGSR